MEKVKDFLFIFLMTAMVFLCGWCSRPVDSSRTEQTTRIDTVVVTDTVRITEFKVKEQKVVDTVYYSIIDTIRLRDTLYYALPREIKQYEDSLFFAQVSGIQPNLDIIEVYPKTKVVTIYTEPPERRWSFGLQAGYGITPKGFQPYLGGGVTYRF